MKPDDVFTILEDPKNAERLINAVLRAQMCVAEDSKVRALEAQQARVEAELAGPPTKNNILDPRRKSDTLTPEELAVLLPIVEEIFKDAQVTTHFVDKGSNLSYALINGGYATTLAKPENLGELLCQAFRLLVRDGTRSARNATIDGRMGTLIRTIWEVKNLASGRRLGTGIR